ARMVCSDPGLEVCLAHTSCDARLEPTKSEGSVPVQNGGSSVAVTGRHLAESSRKTERPRESGLEVLVVILVGSAWWYCGLWGWPVRRLSLRLWYGRGGLCSPDRRWWRAWLPGGADAFRWPGWGGTRGGGPAG